MGFGCNIVIQYYGGRRICVCCLVFFCLWLFGVCFREGFNIRLWNFELNEFPYRVFVYDTSYSGRDGDEGVYFLTVVSVGHTHCVMCEGLVGKSIHNFVT